MAIISLTVKSVNGTALGAPEVWGIDSEKIMRVVPAAAGLDASVYMKAQNSVTSGNEYDVLTVDETIAGFPVTADLLSLTVEEVNGTSIGAPATWLLGAGFVYRVTDDGGQALINIESISPVAAGNNFDQILVSESVNDVIIEDDTVPFDVISANEVQTDTINEKTAAAGVTIDGVLVKDGAVMLNTTVQAVVFNADSNMDDYINDLVDGNVQVVANGVGMFEFDGNNGKNLAKGMLAMENSSYLATENGTAVLSFGDSTGMKLTTATASIAAGGTAASGTANAMKAVVTITGLNAASGASQLVTLSGLTFLKTTDRLTSGIYEYTGTWVTNGIPMVSSVACNLDGTLTIIVTNVHAANALNGSLTVTACWA